MSIRQLPEDVVQKLKSSIVLNSLNGVVCELLKNALDAGSTKINAYLDYTRGNCTVEDDGQGIHPSEFKEYGGLGKLHHTSKYPPSSAIHGTHGNFLAALTNLSLVSIVSHHRNQVSHNSVTFHNGRTLARYSPAPPEQQFHAFRHGTRVAVRDLFGSMPVRVKHRAIVLSEKSQSEKEWTRLLVDVVALALAWPTDVTILLQNSTLQREVRLRSQDKRDIITRTSRLLSQSGLAESAPLDAWVPVSASSRHVKVRGCIYLHPVATRHCQFISLGIYPIRDDYGTNLLYEQVNKSFANSTFAMASGSEVDKADEQKENRPSQSKVKGRAERWPMFYLEIQQPASEVFQSVEHVLHDRSSSLTDIIHVLQAVCYGFLKKHQMQPRKNPTDSSSSVFSTSGKLSKSKKDAKRSQSLPIDRHQGSYPSQDQKDSLSDGPFGAWHRIKSGRPTNPLPSKPDNSCLDRQKNRPPVPLVGPRGVLLRKPFLDVDSEQTSLTDESTDDPVELQNGSRDTNKGQWQNHFITSGQISEFVRSAEQEKPLTSDLLQSALAWHNPVFETVERPLPRAYEDSPKLAHGSNPRTQVSWTNGPDDGGVMFESASMGLQGRISRGALARAEFISQVDRKFILLKLPFEEIAGNGGHKGHTGLIMLDQHAADERCQLESLMRGYFIEDAARGMDVAVDTLERPQVYEISAKEGALLGQYQNYFATWGIVYLVRNPVDKRATSSRVEVTGLPPSISGRCRNEPGLLIEVLRKEVWRLSDEGQHPDAMALKTGASRTSYFRNCPRGILELLHSRSCRSAIMFNDVLTRDDCEGLLRRLAECDFPFQCAHGRPSMAPLVGLGVGDRIGGWNEDGHGVGSNKWWSFMGNPAK